MIWFTNLYYKDRIIWKIFLTQLGPALPLTPDPPVIQLGEWIGWKTHKIQFGECFRQKRIIFLTRSGLTHLLYPPLPQEFMSPLSSWESVDKRSGGAYMSSGHRWHTVSTNSVLQAFSPLRIKNNEIVLFQSLWYPNYREEAMEIGQTELYLYQGEIKAERKACCCEDGCQPNEILFEKKEVRKTSIPTAHGNRWVFCKKILWAYSISMQGLLDTICSSKNIISICNIGYTNK
jgi:hypothetical protein